MAERSLQEFVQEASGESHLRVEHDFGDGFVRLRTTEAERRQAAQDIQCSENIVLELLRNSRDAHAAHVFLAVSKEESKRIITIVDDGDGIPAAMHEHVFEPRVTSKLDTSHKDAWGYHGRGMALFSIAENATEAFVASSEAGLGCAMRIETDTARLPEKADQSGFPRFELTDEGTVNVRGPRNILRTACEFAIESRDTCSVFVGSPAEVSASIYEYGKATLSSFDRAFCRDASKLPIVKRLATASDPEDFVEIASSLGMDVSSRTARRILDGLIGSLDPLIELVDIQRPHASGAASKRRGAGKGRRVKIQKGDAAALADSVKSTYSPIAEQYYLDGDVDPRVRVSRDCITISIPLVERD